MSNPYPNADLRTYNCGPFCRYVIVDSRVKSPALRRYYTGDHTSKASMWVRGAESNPPRKAMLYAHVSLALQDLQALREGRLPEGRRGISGREPSFEEMMGTGDE